jgi:hypothetical protein
LRSSSWPFAARSLPSQLDGRAVQVLADRQARPEPEPLCELPERLAAHDRPAPTLFDYDQLLEREGGR